MILIAGIIAPKIGMTFCKFLLKRLKTKSPSIKIEGLELCVGMARFELATSWSQTRRDNRATLHPELLVIDL
jgi:hypothetical protein